MENGRNRLEQAQQDVDDVKVIMVQNMNKASERDVKLGDLEDRADQLLEQSKLFYKTSNQVKQKKRWENRNWKVIGAIAAVTVGVAIVIILAVVLGTGDG